MSAYDDLVLASSPLVYYTGQDAASRTGSPQVITDYSGNGNHGEEMNGGPTLYRALLADGVIVDEFAADGVGARSGTGLWSNGIDWTAEVWMDYTATVPPGANKILMSAWETGGEFFHINLKTDGKVSYTFKNSGAANVVLAANDVAVQNTRYHVVATYNSVTGRKLYINGVEQASTSDTYQKNSIQKRISYGNWPNAVVASSTWNGAIGKIGFYTSTLSPETITAHYLEGIGAGGGGSVFVPILRRRRRV